MQEPQKIKIKEAASALSVKQPFSSVDKKRLDEMGKENSHNDGGEEIMIELAKYETVSHTRKLARPTPRPECTC